MKYREDFEKNLQIFRYASTDSTNKRAKLYATPSFSGHALFVADSQTEGRGRLGRSFFSPAGTGLYLSYLFSTKEPLSSFGAITPAAAVATARVLERHCRHRVGIKWVNDLYVDERKVCGILTEAVSALSEGEENKIVVGIGVNLSTAFFPAEIRQIAGSLNIETDTMALAVEIARELSIYAAHPHDRSFMEEYKARSIVVGRQVLLIKGDETIKGEVAGFDGDGGLLLKTEEGVRLFTGGEISLRLDPR